ncbi:exopolysaccharide biosynthesis protein [Aureimonas endophytica]|uniref:Exopolysaccharide biosynthesis protein n=1 Tax=Aureimonas endophytica TaxID=2027858 RepID=A0A916ZEQ9_9HYPH|nr:polysaccharide biosynthesis/export family protein [Aureimonas endophytica]GGD90321.1 exopolysaccharide biosynthesis protein [Aureimonas endophytica]
MRRRSTAALAAALLLASGFAALAAGSPAPQQTERQGLAAPAVAPGAYAIGDRLRITFFEALEMPAGEDADAPSGGFYQRADLTADYDIGADGMLNIPRLGRIAAEGREPQAVEADIRKAYEDAMDRAGDAHVAIVERQPVYVLGPVRTPGAYPYADGMLALKAIALAGGMERRSAAAAPLAEVGREEERSQTAAQELAQLLARRARLEAVRFGGDAVAPAELVRLVGAAGAADLLRAETLAEGDARTLRRHEREKLADALASARAKQDDLGAAIVGTERDIGERRAAIAKATEPDPRLSKTGIIAARSAEIASLEQERTQLRAEFRDGERGLTELKARMERVELGARAEAAQELLRLTSEIARLRQVAASASGLALVLGGDPARDDPAAYPVEIVRMSAEGVRTFKGDSATLLRPGDVVRLVPASAAGALTAADLTTP